MLIMSKICLHIFNDVQVRRISCSSSWWILDQCSIIEADLLQLRFLCHICFQNLLTFTRIFGAQSKYGCTQHITLLFGFVAVQFILISFGVWVYLIHKSQVNLVEARIVYFSNSLCCAFCKCTKVSGFVNSVCFVIRRFKLYPWACMHVLACLCAVILQKQNFQVALWNL